MTPEERSAVMGNARWNARENAPATQVSESCRVLAVASGKGGVGRSSVTVNLAAALAAEGYTVYRVRWRHTPSRRSTIRATPTR